MKEYLIVRHKLSVLNGLFESSDPCLSEVIELEHRKVDLETYLTVLLVKRFRMGGFRALSKNSPNHKRLAEGLRLYSDWQPWGAYLRH